jgi:hypothetical protein
MLIVDQPTQMCAANLTQILHEADLYLTRRFVLANASAIVILNNHLGGRLALAPVTPTLATRMQQTGNEQ